MGFWNIKEIYGSHLSQYLTNEAFLGVNLFLKFLQCKISFPMIYSIIWFWNINFWATGAVGSKGGNIPRVMSQNAQGLRRWGFQHEFYTPSPSFHVKTSFVQICFRWAPFSGFIYWTISTYVLNEWPLIVNKAI